MNIQTHRRKRRREKAKLKNSASVRRHARVAGRTGHIHAKQTPANKVSGYRSRFLGIPLPWFFSIRKTLSRSLDGDDGGEGGIP